MTLSLLLIMFCFVGYSSASFCDSSGAWKTVFKDDFNTFDSNVWSITTGKDVGQGRDAYLTVDNVYVQSGNLVLRSQKQDMGGLNYTSGAVTTKQSWTNARVCVNAKLPGVSHQYGQGIWPAHWLLAGDHSCWPDKGEIDIMEMINGDGNVHGTYHWNPDYPGTKCNAKDAMVTGQTSLTDDSWANSYHEYATEWGNDYVAFLLDSKVYINITASSHNPVPHFPTVSMYLILNTAVGGPWPGPPNPSTRFPAYHFIDSVSVAVVGANQLVG